MNTVANLFGTSTLGELAARVASREVHLNGLGAVHQAVCRLATMTCCAGFLGLDTGHNKAKCIRHALRLFGGLHKGLLQRFGGGRQTTWLSFFNLCHVAVGAHKVTCWVARGFTTK